jgi:hypothetical protein
MAGNPVHARSLRNWSSTRAKRQSLSGRAEAGWTVPVLARSTLSGAAKAKKRSTHAPVNSSAWRMTSVISQGTSPGLSVVESVRADTVLCPLV